MKEDKVETAVLIFGFIRPDTTEKVFARVREAKPTKLFLCLDAPRDDHPADNAKCEAVRKIFDAVDWPCKVHKNYAERNMGCDPRVASGIDWAFQHTESLIILEDDCLPDMTFFTFCQDLLGRYQDDERVGMIAGHRANFSPVQTYGASYYFNRIPITWGWATWRRAWQKFDFSMNDWPEIVRRGLLDDLFPQQTASILEKLYQRYFETRITWDCAWGYSMIKENMLCIHPASNLVTNIGFTEDATHNHTNPNSPWANIPTHAMPFPLVHPLAMIPQTDSELSRLKQCAEAGLCARMMRYVGRKCGLV